MQNGKGDVQLSGKVKPKILSSRVFFFQVCTTAFRSSFSLFDLHYSLGGIKIASPKKTFMQHRFFVTMRIKWYIPKYDVHSKGFIIRIVPKFLNGVLASITGKFWLCLGVFRLYGKPGGARCRHSLSAGPGCQSTSAWITSDSEILIFISTDSFIIENSAYDFLALSSTGFSR